MKRYITPQEAIDAGWRWRLFLAKAWQPMLFGLLITLAFLACGAPALAQRQVYVATRDFPELNHANGRKTLAEIGIDGRTKYPAAYRWWTDILQQPGARFQEFFVASAVYNQVTWSGHSGSWTPGALCTSYNSFDASGAFGFYWVNVGITVPRGRIVGAGTGIGTGGEPLYNPNASTELSYNHARWIDPRAMRAVMQTGNTGLSGYYESCYISDFRISGNGPNFYDPSYTQHGLVATTMGEGFVIDRLEVNTCNGHGLWVNGAGPGSVRYLSSFDNNLAGLCFGDERNTGRSLMGFLTVDFLSCDNNVWAVLNNGGGGMSIGYIKSEDGLSSQRGRPKKGQVVIESHGWNNIVVSSITDAVSGASPAAFVVNALSNANRIMVESYVQKAANTGSANGRTALLMCPRTREVFRTADPNGMKLEPISFEWRGTGTVSSVLTCSTPMVKSSCPAQTRLGLASTYAGYDYAAGTPALDLTFGGSAPPPPPPPPAPCTFTYSAWSACSNGTQTRTATSAPTGCTGTPPPDSVSRACTVAPPPPPPGVTGTFNPNDVLVVSNSADPRSAAWATAYAQAWGIPSANIVTVNAGTSHVATSATLTAIRNAVNARGLQITLLAWEYPSRLGNGQSITSAVDFGERNPDLFTVSPHFGYTGLRPRADRGFAKSFLLVSDRYIRRDAHGTRPSGQAILHLAKDSPSQGNPRGSARAGQTAAGVTVWDMRATAIGGGQNACNYINNGCFLSQFRPGATPIIAAYQSNFYLAEDGGIAWAKGFYGDHVTSVGGVLPPGAPPAFVNGAGQTCFVYHLERGASMSVGSVVEPWQGAGGSLARQFVRVDLFHPRFVSGLPVGAAAYSSVECPDRMLFAGDPLCAPFAR